MTDKVDSAIYIFDSEYNRVKTIKLQTLLNRQMDEFMVQICSKLDPRGEMIHQTRNQHFFLSWLLL